MKRLFAFGRLAHDPQGVLTAVYRLACMRVELVADTSESSVGVYGRFRCCLELGIAAFTNSEHWDMPGLFYDSQLAFGHVQSLAHRKDGSRPVEIKRHHYPKAQALDRQPAWKDNSPSFRPRWHIP